MAASNPLKSIQKGNKKTKSQRNGSKISAKTMAIALLAVLALVIFAIYEMPRSKAQNETFYNPVTTVSSSEMKGESEASSASEMLGAERGKEKKNKKEKVDIWTINYEQEALPELPGSVTSQIIHHKAYSTSYNAEYKIPNWAFYELTLAETMGRLPRSDNFQPDPSVKYRESAQLTDYRGSGYDRGHMAPSMDFNWDADIEDETYFLSNMCPQGHDFNSGIWLDLEHQVRRWAERDSAICVVCGPILPRKDKNGKLINPVTNQEYQIKTIGRNKVLVPEHFFKVILSPFGDHPKAIGFIMPNQNVMRRDGRGNAPVKDFAKNVDYVEKVTGIDFFSILPDDIEDKIEAWYENDDWFKKSNNYRK